MENFTIEVTQGTFATAKEARRVDQLPIIYYGNAIEPRKFFADLQDFRRTYKKTGKSAILTLKIDKEELPCLVQDIQYHPVTNEMIHIDLKRVDLSKAVKTHIPLKFVGIAPAIKEMGGTLTTARTSLHVECLPKDLVREIEVDISSLVDFHTSIQVSDIKVPAGYKVLDNAGINVATAIQPRMEEEAVGAPVAPITTEILKEVKPEEEAAKEA